MNLRSTAIALLTAAALATAISGCAKDGNPSAATSPSMATSPSATVSASASAGNAENAKVCANINKTIKDTLAKVAEAEAIGPPAGHLAVSAAWSAGAAKLYADSIDATGQVATEAKALGEAMGEIAGKYTSAKAKPDKAAVTAAIAKIQVTCGV